MVSIHGYGSWRGLSFRFHHPRYNAAPLRAFLRSSNQARATSCVFTGRDKEWVARAKESGTMESQ